MAVVMVAMRVDMWAPWSVEWLVLVSVDGMVVQ